MREWKRAGSGVDPHLISEDDEVSLELLNMGIVWTWGVYRKSPRRMFIVGGDCRSSEEAKTLADAAWEAWQQIEKVARDAVA